MNKISLQKTTEYAASQVINAQILHHTLKTPFTPRMPSSHILLLYGALRAVPLALGNALQPHADGVVAAGAAIPCLADEQVDVTRGPALLAALLQPLLQRPVPGTPAPLGCSETGDIDPSFAEHSNLAVRLCHKDCFKPLELCTDCQDNSTISWFGQLRFLPEFGMLGRFPITTEKEAETFLFWERKELSPPPLPARR